MAPTNKVTNLKVVKKDKETSRVSALSPREIVSELDRYVIGQKDAKKAVAVALRNRWRRQALTDEMRDEVLPKNILMIGPTGVGKTEISRRLSKLAEAPFIKVEATRFTEVGYVGRDVEQIIRDLIEIAIAMEREKKRKEVKAKAELKAEEKVLDALVGNKASVATRESFRKRLRTGDLDNNEIEIEVHNTSNPLQSFEIPGMPGGNVGMVNLGDILGKSIGGKKGWLYANFLWVIRGYIDLLVGGVGLRRGRRHLSELKQGDALDFWRVEKIVINHLVRLKAEMKLPGKAWLEYEILEDEKKCTLIQKAYFMPTGLFGLFYWYSLYPIHKIIFSGLIKTIKSKVEFSN